MNANGYIYRNSYIHKLNPSLKFMGFILFTVLIFVQTGLFFQIIILLMILCLFCLSSLPFRLLSKTLKSIFFIFLILLLVNWITSKNPLFLHSYTNFFALGKLPTTLTQPSAMITSQNSGYTANGTVFVDFIFGGSYYGSVNNNGLFGNLVSTYSNINPPSGYQVFLVGDGKYIYFQTFWYTFFLGNFFTALNISLKIFMMILISTILTSTTSTVELTAAIEDILSPLKILLFPAHEFAMIISIALRFIPSLTEEANKIMYAQSSRGSDFKNGNLLTKARVLSSLIIPLFTISFTKAFDLANAMEVRGYNPRHDRSRYRIFSIKLPDILGLLLLIIFFSFVIFATYHRFFFTYFGFFGAVI